MKNYVEWETMGIITSLFQIIINGDIFSGGLLSWAQDYGMNIVGMASGAFIGVAVSISF